MIPRPQFLCIFLNYDGTLCLKGTCTQTYKHSHTYSIDLSILFFFSFFNLHVVLIFTQGPHMANYVIPTSLIFLLYEEEFVPVRTWYMMAKFRFWERGRGYVPPKKVTQALKIHSCWRPPLLKKNLTIICQLKDLASILLNKTKKLYSWRYCFFFILDILLPIFFMTTQWIM